ncbi:hypothetical protein DVH24_005292 [Malus domestica]|uniref:Uncharacterized protein n=1 Tax=Malus domestica TaxID=3750 RepID=A0A498KH71_MALDO|nr:hypothetical protein DVH24_005292 [Malus domestica]
MPSSFIYFINL